MASNKQALLLGYAGFVLLFSVLTVLFWAFMSDNVLVPLYYLLWVGGLLLNSVPQAAYLTLLVVGSVIISSKILSSLHAGQYRRRVMRHPSGATTRYQHWRTLCDLAHGNWFSKGQLAFEVRTLILAILAFEHSVDPSEAEMMVRNGVLEVPTVLRNVVETKYIPDTAPNRFSGVLSWLRRSGSRAKTNTDPFVEQLLTELIRFAETHLEITTHAGNESES